MVHLLSSKLDEKVKEFITSSISRSYRVDNIEITDDKIAVKFVDEVSEEEYIKLIKNLLYISKSINHDILFKNNVSHPYNENPMKYLEDSKEVIKIANGIYLFQGKFLKLLHFFNNYIKDISKKYNAIEQEYPALWPIDLFKKINYFKEFPQQVILTTTVKNGFNAKNQFSQLYDNKNDYNSVLTDNNMDSCYYGLAPSVCDTCYYVLQNETDIGNKFYTTFNKVFRHEFSNIDSLDRLLQFSMREIVFVGDQDFVLMARQRLIDDLIDFLKFIDIDCKIETANDPFFTNDSIIKNVFQYSSRLKYELLAKLNYSNSYIAIGSINLHLDFFGKAFNVKLPDNTYAHSGCIGIGFERLVYSLYCQYGHDVAKWPHKFIEKL